MRNEGQHDVGGCGEVDDCLPHNTVRFPAWLKRGLAYSGRTREVEGLISSCQLNTVCAEAKCPNRGECFSRGSAAFLILGPVCTRDCAFCGVESGRPADVDVDEGERLAEAAFRMGLRHIVVTSVTRDDLNDGGAFAFADALARLRDKIPQITTEVLIPDFQGSGSALMTVLNAEPDILNHNVETVPRLYPLIRPQAIYERSLELLKRAAEDGRAVVKSGIMAGLGETVCEVESLMRDLRASGCTVITVGQYLRPSRRQVPVKEFITPDQFAAYEEMALGMGFESAFCGPYVRSSYRAEELNSGRRRG
ncbi:MAG: lipoyl synthase [Chitinispirillia bacterium]|nr:lipoyl synthase [Chitinispirillia bacterium]MCL2241232.1 lipoyl synthase [Chitinispirillia bacterium]